MRIDTEAQAQTESKEHKAQSIEHKAQSIEHRTQSTEPESRDRRDRHRDKHRDIGDGGGGNYVMAAAER